MKQSDDPGIAYTGMLAKGKLNFKKAKFKAHGTLY